MRRNGILAGFIAGMVVGFLAVSILGRPALSSEDTLLKEFFQPLAWVIQQIEKNYVEEVDPHKLLVGAYEGVLSRLDKYSTYIPPDMYSEFEADTKGYFGGLGIQIRFYPIEKVLRVEQPIPGTPAFKVGVLAGDKIIRIKEEPTGEAVEVQDFKSVHDAVKILRGKPGTKVTITVVHAGNEQKREDLTIKRDIINIPGVRAAHVIDNKRKIGYLYLAYFSEKTLGDLDEALKMLKAAGMRALVVDLRFNPGGLLSTAKEVSDRFLGGGVVVSTRGRNAGEEVFRAQRDGDDCVDIPLVILVNRYSASASEIVAGAVKDNGRGIIVGEKTFGKGSVQSLVRLPSDGGALKLTTARYYTPDGICIEGKGIEPDIEIKLSEEENRDLVQHLGQYVGYPPEKRPGDEDAQEPPDGNEPAAPQPGAEPQPKHTEQQFVDRQLGRALDVLRGILVQQQLEHRRAVSAARALAD